MNELEREDNTSRYNARKHDITVEGINELRKTASFPNEEIKMCKWREEGNE